MSELKPAASNPRSEEDKAALKWVGDNLREYFGPGGVWNAWAHSRANSLSRLLSAWNRPAGGWIRVEDGLPEEGERILAYPCVSGKRVLYGTFTGEFLLGVAGGALEMPGHITHWRPLPPPPEEP